MCATSHKKPLSPGVDGFDYYTIYRGKIQSVLHVALFEMSLMVIDCVCDTPKPLFHWKSRSHWLPNANEIDTNNMKCTCPTPAPRVGDPTPPIFHLLALGVGVGETQILVFALGGTQILAFLDTNMLV